MSRRLVYLAALLVGALSAVLATLLVPSASSTIQRDVSCSPPTIVPPGQRGKIGPLRIGGIHQEAGSVEIAFLQWTPTKVLLRVNRALKRTVRLRGWRCEDGAVLRFQYGGPPLLPPPHTEEDLRRLGTRVAVFRPYPCPRTTRCGYAGYMLFTSTGNWKLNAYETGRRVGTLVLVVVPMAQSKAMGGRKLTPEFQLRQ